jgi:hypothetical protein
MPDTTLGALREKHVYKLVYAFRAMSGLLDVERIDIRYARLIAIAIARSTDRDYEDIEIPLTRTRDGNGTSRYFGSVWNPVSEASGSC